LLLKFVKDKKILYNINLNLGVSMNYTKEIEFSFKDDIKKLEFRTKLWATKYKFKLVERDSIKWVFKRGNHFRASCSFDVRYVPTTVKIYYLVGVKKVNISFHVKSLFYATMPDDKFRVDEQVELLIAYLKGIFDNYI